jgi:hypothetical protein
VTLHCPDCGSVIPEQKQRSPQNHSHYFAALHDSWLNLPEAISGEFPSPEHLRKYALIKAGYCSITKMVCRFNKDAVEAANFISQIDEFALCNIAANVVTVYRARSQSYKSMGKEQFAKSKSDVLEIASSMVGADVAQDGQAA